MLENNGSQLLILGWLSCFEDHVKHISQPVGHIMVEVLVSIGITETIPTASHVFALWRDGDSTELEL